MNDLKTLISEEEIRTRVAQLGAKITEDYRGKNPLLVCVLRGACVFFADLIRKIETPLTIDFTAVSSYGGEKTSSGEVRVVKEISEDVSGRHVIIVEDIIDSGLTLKFMKGYFTDKNAASVKICALLDKPEGRKTDVAFDYAGFVIPDEFVVGYGLDFAEAYRNLPEIAILEEPAL